MDEKIVAKAGEDTDARSATLKLTFPVETNAIGPGTEIWNDARNESYRVRSRELHVDAQGQLRLVLILGPTKPRWIKWFDKVSIQQSWLPGAVAMVTLAIAGVLGILLYPAVTDRKVLLGVAGCAIVAVPWIVPVVCALVAFFWTWPTRRRIGIALCAVAMITAVFLGVGLGFAWHTLLIPSADRAWPTGYADLATSFSQRASATFAVIGVYAPVLLLVLKLLKIDWLGELAGGVLRKPGGA